MRKAWQAICGFVMDMLIACNKENDTLRSLADLATPPTERELAIARRYEESAAWRIGSAIVRHPAIATEIILPQIAAWEAQLIAQLQETPCEP